LIFGEFLIVHIQFCGFRRVAVSDVSRNFRKGAEWTLKRRSCLLDCRVDICWRSSSRARFRLGRIG
jgi:hypothetical protein